MQASRLVRIATLSLLFVAAAAAFAQDAHAPAGAPAGAPSGVPASLMPPWISWVLDAGVPGLLMLGFWKLWGHFNEKDKQHQIEKDAWATEKTAILTAHATERASLKEQHDKEHDRVWEEARRDKAELRVCFDHDRAATQAKLDTLQAKLDREQVDRREEAERLLREHTTLTREVVVTAQAMASSLQESTRSTDQLVETIKKGV